MLKILLGGFLGFRVLLSRPYEKENRAFSSCKIEHSRPKSVTTCNGFYKAQGPKRTFNSFYAVLNVKTT